MPAVTPRFTTGSKLAVHRMSDDSLYLHPPRVLPQMRLVAIYVYLLEWNVSRSPDPVGLSRDPSKVGRYLDGMWMSARVGTGAHWQERSAAAVTGGRQASRQATPPTRHIARRSV